MTDTIKILVDTDPGSDIDDATCLAYLLAQPRCDLLGITTVTGQPVARARLASAICHAFDRPDIPIYPGAAEPLLAVPRQPDVPQARVLPDWPHAPQFPVGGAVEFLRRTIRAHPGEIVLLGIGPFTNLALLFALDPEIPRLLRGLLVMGGRFPSWNMTHETVEWNLRVDPHAAAMLYRAAAPFHRSVGVEMTNQLRIGQAAAQDLLRGDRLAPVRAMAEEWFERSRDMLFHDTITAATLFSDAVCTFKRGRVVVEIGSEHLAGFSYWQPESGFESGCMDELPGLPPGAPSPHEIAAGFSAEAFLSHLRETFDTVSPG